MLLRIYTCEGFETFLCLITKWCQVVLGGLIVVASTLVVFCKLVDRIKDQRTRYGTEDK